MLAFECKATLINDFTEPRGQCLHGVCLCFRHFTSPSHCSMGCTCKPKNRAGVTAGWRLNFAPNSLYHPNSRDSRKEEFFLQPLQTVGIVQHTYGPLPVLVSGWVGRRVSGEKMRPSLWFHHVLLNFHIGRPLLRRIFNQEVAETMCLKGVNCLSELIRH